MEGRVAYLSRNSIIELSEQSLAGRRVWRELFSRRLRSIVMAIAMQLAANEDTVTKIIRFCVDEETSDFNRSALGDRVTETAVGSSELWRQAGTTRVPLFYPPGREQRDLAAGRRLSSRASDGSSPGSGATTGRPATTFLI